MEPIQSTPSLAEDGLPSAGELVVQNGRLGGARKALVSPLTLIGQAEGCHVRLAVEGVSSMHCAIVAGTGGLWAQDLGSVSGTLVNGELITARLLRDADLLTVGPFRFRVRLAEAAKEPSLAAGASAHSADSHDAERERELDALRIQAAAVAAQQAALTEEEARVEQRRAALDQQEKQLAAHLEEKRRQLVHLQEQVSAARTEVHQQKKTHEQHVGAVVDDLARERTALAESQRQARRERARLVDLRRDLKRRWHRHWMAERNKARRSEQDLAGERLKLEREVERIQEAKASLTQDRLRHNGESELARRQLQDAWSELRRKQNEWRDQTARNEAELRDRACTADRRDAALAAAQQQLEDQKRQWQGTRLHLEKEADGLENRIRNQRRKLLEQEKEVLRLDTVITDRTEALAKDASATPASPSGETVESAIPSTGRAGLSLCAESVASEVSPQQMQADMHAPLTMLERVAEDLADQRMHVVEQWQRLLATRRSWESQHDTAAAELEAFAIHLQDQEKVIADRDRALVAGEHGLRQRLAEVIHLRQNLEGCQARLRTRVIAWEAERDRLLATVTVRERLTERRLKGAADLRSHWTKRRRTELERTRADLAAAGKLHTECAALRDECLQRKVVLEQKERSLAEQALALEQYRLECTGQSEDSPAAERQMERLRRRWASLSTAAERAVAGERQAIQAESALADARYQEALKLGRTLAAQQARQAEQQTAWEHERALLKGKHDCLRQEVEDIQLQRDRYEKQVADLRQEVDRVARVLLDDDEPAALPLAQAA